MAYWRSSLEPILECLGGVCTTSFIGSSATPCGPDLSCDPEADICVARGPLGSSIQYGCEPIPTGCDEERDCSCTATSLCPAPSNSCIDPAANTVRCL